MDLADAIYAELTSISKFAGKIGEDQIWQDSIPKNKTTDELRKEKNIFITFDIDENDGETKIGIAEQIVDFRIIGAIEKDSDLRIARDILRDHFFGVKNLGGEFLIHHARKVDTGGDIDFDPKEKTLVLTMAFYFIAPPAGELS